MTTQIYHMYDSFVECKKRTYYRPEKKWRVLLDDKIIAKVESEKLSNFLDRLRYRLKQLQK